MDHEEMKLECIRIVMAADPPLSRDQVLVEAMKYYNWIRGRPLDDAGGESISYRADKIETPMATVHKRPPFLDDYKPD